MNCKFCNEELPENVTLCPACGGENLEEETETVVEEMTAEPSEEVTGEASEEVIEEQMEETDLPAPAPKQKPKVWMVILAVVGAIALIGVLIGALLYGVKATGKKAQSYTASGEAAVKARDVVVATVGDVELTNSELQIYFWQSVDEFYNYYGYYMDAETLDMEKPLDQQYN